MHKQSHRRFFDLRSALPVASVCALAASGVGSAIGQVVTPPPAEVTPIDWNIPKMPPAPSMPTADVTPTPPPRPVTPPPARLPDLPYTPLAEKGADGKILPLKEPLHISATRRNPMLPEGFMDQIAPVLEERRGRVDTLVVANLDVIERIEDGIFESVDFNNRATVRTLMDTIRPLTSAMKTLGEDLRERGLMDQMQTRFNNKIVNDYVRAVNEEKAAAAEKDKVQSGQSLLMSLYKQNVDEFVFTYEKSMAHACGRFSEALAGVQADEATLSKAREIGAAAASKATEAEKLAALKGLRDVLTLDQRRQLVQEAIRLWRQQ
jgi:hypothetical protein